MISASILVEKIQGAATAERNLVENWPTHWSSTRNWKKRKKWRKKKKEEEERRGEAKIERVLRWECLMAARCCSLGEVCRPPLSFLSGPPIQHSVCDSQWPAKCASRRSPPLFLVPTLWRSFSLSSFFEPANRGPHWETGAIFWKKKRKKTKRKGREKKEEGKEGGKR